MRPKKKLKKSFQELIKSWECKTEENQRPFQHGLFGSPALAEMHIFWLQRQQFQANRSGVMLQSTDDSWESAGEMLGNSLGNYFGDSDEINRTIPRQSSQQIKCDACFHRSSQDGYRQSDMQLAQECRKPCQKGGWKKLSLSMVIFPSPWTFSADVNKVVIMQIFVNKNLTWYLEAKLCENIFLVIPACRFYNLNSF